MTECNVSTFSGFEGPEKKLEIDFKMIEKDGNVKFASFPVEKSDRKQGLRSIALERWQELCSLVACTVLSTVSNDHFDSFVLSESSLFVYPQKFLMKTCGTTTLLACLDKILEFAKELDMEVECAFYSRQKFLFPEKQKAPHTSFRAEVERLNAIFPGGQGFCLGEQTGDHWYLYHVDRSLGKPDELRKDRTMEVMMHDLDPAVMRLFHTDSFVSKDLAASSLYAAGVLKENDISSLPDAISSAIDSGNKQEAARAAIRQLLPLQNLFQGIAIDDHMFEPCGYSVNGLQNGSYVTIHVTPEIEHSFVSFETNSLHLEPQQFISWIAKYLRPGRLSLSVFSDANVGSPTAAVIRLDGYRRLARTHYELFSADDTMPYDVLYVSLTKRD